MKTLEIVSILGITALIPVAIATGAAYVIIVTGIAISLVALEGDISYSTDHPLVKAQGLPL